MTRILAVIMAALLLTLPVRAASYDPDFPRLSKKDRSAMRHVVEAQLKAFLRDDAELAFSFATPTVQRRFRNAEEFLPFVRDVYPAISRSHDVEFRQIKLTEDGPELLIFLIGPGSQPLHGHYLMEKQRDGRWKIDGCKITPGNGLGV